jgi:hypothetical protein
MAGPWQPMQTRAPNVAGGILGRKALRVGTALQEKQAQALQMEMDNAPAAAAAAAAKIARERQKETRLQQKWDREKAELALGDLRDSNAAAIEAYDRTEGTPAEKSVAANAAFRVAAEAAPNTPSIGNDLDEFVWDYDTALAQNAEIDDSRPNAPQKANFIGDDGRAHAGPYDPNTKQYSDASGKVHSKASPIAQGATQSEISNFPGTASQRGAQYLANIEEYNTSSDVQELIGSALPQVVEMPGAVGIKGAFGSGGAGLLTALGQEEMADAFSQWMSGADQTEITQLQTQLQVLRGRIIPIVTGEQSKRLSEMEREIASTVVGLIESIKGPADLTKAYPQVVGAMRQLYAESWVRKFNISSRDEDVAYPYDLSDKEQRIELFTEFSEAGVDMNTAKRTMIRLKSIQGVE